MPNHRGVPQCPTRGDSRNGPSGASIRLRRCRRYRPMH
jgi:hypothetical protein